MKIYEEICTRDACSFECVEDLYGKLRGPVETLF